MLFISNSITRSSGRACQRSLKTFLVILRRECLPGNQTHNNDSRSWNSAVFLRTHCKLHCDHQLIQHQSPELNKKSFIWTVKSVQLMTHPFIFNMIYDVTISFVLLDLFVDGFGFSWDSYSRRLIIIKTNKYINKLKRNTKIKRALTWWIMTIHTIVCNLVDYL